MESDLAEEERMPAGSCEDGLEQLRRRRRSGDAPDQGGCLISVKLCEPDADAVPLTVELGERLAQRMGQIDLRVSVRPDDEEPILREQAPEVAQELERRRVRPLEVVEQDDQCPLGDAKEETGQRLVRAEAGLVRR
jgi:hypothetical protein